MSRYNHFVQNHAVYAWMGVLLFSGYILNAWHEADKPPIAFGKVLSIEHAAPGWPAAINVAGQRYRRDCQVSVTRTVIDSAGEYRQAFGAKFDKDELKRLQAKYGDLIPIRYTMPLGLKPGPGEFINDAFYICGWWHRNFGPKKVQFRTLIKILEPPK